MPAFSSQGLRLAYIDEAPTDAARQPPVLLIHGFASSLRVNWAATGWVAHLRSQGRRVAALDNRGHGGSDKPHEAEAYSTPIMAKDAENLLDHLEITQADVIGYSMGARIGAFLALAAPGRVRRLALGGLGDRLVQGDLLPSGIDLAMAAPSLDSLTDPVQRMFRAFAEAGGNDLAALGACIRGSRQSLRQDEAKRILQPTLVAVGTKDPIAGDAGALAALLPHGKAFAIEGRDHNRAVGDVSFKNAVTAFFAAAAI